MPLFYALFYYCGHFCIAAWSTQPCACVRAVVSPSPVVSPDGKQMGASVHPSRSESGLSPTTPIRRVSARARTLGTVGQPPRRDAKRPQRRVRTAASAVSAAVRRQKWTFLPEEPTAVPSHRGRRLLLVSVGPNGTTPRHSKEMYWALQSESDSSHYEDRGQSCSKSALDCRSLKRLLLVCQVKKTRKKRFLSLLTFSWIIFQAEFCRTERTKQNKNSVTSKTIALINVNNKSMSCHPLLAASSILWRYTCHDPSRLWIALKFWRSCDFDCL